MSRLKQYWVLAVLVLLLVILQYKLWFSESGFSKHKVLRAKIDEVRRDNKIAAKQNDALAEEVQHIKGSEEEIENHARYDLGMIAPGEEYYQIVTSSENKGEKNEDSIK